MKKFVIALLCVIALCGVAAADIVYSTTDGKLGLISIKGITSIDLEGIQYETGFEKPTMGAYWDDETLRMIVVGQSEDISYDVAIRFSPSDLTKPTDTKPITLKGVSDTSKIISISNGRGLYIVYGPSIREFETDTLTPKEDDRSYTYTTSNEEVDPNIKGALLTGNRIYVLVNDQLIAFDGQLDKNAQGVKKWNVESGAEVLCGLSGSRLAIGHSTGVQVLGSSLKKLLADTSQVKAISPDSSNGFYYVLEDESGDKTLCHYNSATSNEILKFDSDTIDIKRDTGNKILAVILEDKIQLYDMTDNDKLVSEFNNAALGGSPYKLMRRSTSTTNTSSSSKKNDSGCNFSNAGILLALSLCCITIYRKNNKAKNFTE